MVTKDDLVSKDAALKMAIEAMTAIYSTHGFQKYIDDAKEKATQACEEAIAHPQQQWVGLSKEHKNQCIAECGSVSEYQFKVIEAKLKELNT